MNALFRCSLVLNLILMALLLLAPAYGPKRGPHRPVLAEMTNRTLRVTPGVPHFDGRDAFNRVPLRPPRILEVDEPFHWAQLESEDYRVYVTNLLAIGCPPETLQSIIRAEIRELFQAKVAELVSLETANFWNLMCDKEAFEAKVREKGDELDELEERRDEMLEALLGPQSSWSNPDFEVAKISERKTVNYLLEYLAPEKRELVRAVQQQFAALRQDLSRTPAVDAVQVQGAAAVAAWRKAREEELRAGEEAALKNALTPAEYEEYQLRTAFNSSTLRDAVGFSATEQQLKALLQLEGKYLKPLAQGQARDDWQQQLAELKATLGPERIAAYERAKDGRFSGAYEFVQRSGLAEEMAASLFELQRDAEERLNKIRRNLPADERQAATSALGQEYRTALRHELGTNYELYLRSAGHWMNQF